MGALDSNISLLVASLDLKLVQLLRGAMAIADINGAATAPAEGSSATDTFERRRHFQPTPIYEPRRHIHPEPRVEPGPVVHDMPRLANESAGCDVYVAPAGSKSPIEPPWKVLPWENPPAPPPKIKYVIHQPDTARSKGVFVNVFA